MSMGNPPPFLMGLSHRIHAAVFSFIAGVTPPMPAFIGLEPIAPKSRWVSHCCKSRAILSPGFGPPQSFQRCTGSTIRPLPGRRLQSNLPRGANSATVSRDIGVLLRFAWLDVFKPNTLLFSPCHRGPTDIFWAVIHCPAVDTKYR